MSERELDQLISMIEARPTMFLDSHSLVRLRAFLDGWWVGKENSMAFSMTLGRFQDWVKIRLHAQSFPAHWERMITYVARDDRDAFETFFSLYKEFRLQTDADQANPS